ncbi:MAG: type III secretion system export apparatus subunit SctV [Pseudomonadota bacterium]
MNRFLSALTASSEVALIALLMMIMFLLIIPMPFLLVDTLIALNLSISILLLITTIYIRQPLEISTFPAILLISVLFRLALSITTTRLILTTGSGGSIVTTFGDFVVSGNIVVGIVIFLIITVVQFVVIVKGSERIAEVSARFTLDALPGKQLSIDSDLRNGVLSVDEAQEKRATLERQSQFYGAMDGATKFVKGDAIAGLVITFVNLVGGLAIGMLQLGLTFEQAIEIYSRQTVGDGLIAQIPALFIAIAAGSLVTRVASDESTNLGRDIGNELIAQPTTLAAVAIVLLIFGFIPGFPSTVFFMLSGTFVIGSLIARRARAGAAAARRLPVSDFGAVDASMNRVEPMTPLTLQLGSSLDDRLDKDDILRSFEHVRERAYVNRGIWLPPIGLATYIGGPADGYRILLDEVAKLEGALPLGYRLFDDEPDYANLVDVEVIERDDIIPGRAMKLVYEENAATLRALGIETEPSERLIERAVEEVVYKYSSHFVGLEETKLLLNHFGKHYSELVNQVQSTGSISQLSAVLQRFVADGMSIRNLRAILQGYLEWSSKEDDPIVLSEYVRTTLKEQLCHPYVDPEGMMAVLLLQSDAEDAIRQRIQETTVGSYLALDAERTTALVSQVGHYWGAALEKGATCVVVTSIDIRRYVRNALRINDVDIPVFSYQDIALDVRIHPIGVIDLKVGDASA